MAQYEQPVNLITFKDGAEPENKRIEEQFMYKYMQLKPEKVQKKKKTTLDATTGEDDEDEFEDSDLENFANAEMDREMKRMASGAPGGMPDSDEEEVSLEDMSIEDDGSSDDEAGFFSGEDDLQNVEIEGDQEDDEKDDGEDDAEEDSYGSEGDAASEDIEEGVDDDEEGSELPQEEVTAKNKQKSKKAEDKAMRKTKLGTKYASYEEFAHLLEDGLDDEIDKPNIKKHKLAQPNYAA